MEPSLVNPPACSSSYHKAIYRFNKLNSTIEFSENPTRPLDSDSVNICILIIGFPELSLKKANTSLWIWAGASTTSDFPGSAQLNTISVAYTTGSTSLSSTILSSSVEDNEKEIATRLSKRFARPITLSTDTRVLSLKTYSQTADKTTTEFSIPVAEQCILAEITKLLA
ncbi:hypothetical protein BB561_002955 [Smittium simulii]|uniref:Proteasome assembly chaperone 4 n=1 Tax=Smittium simulii TaxID=133385 RepID=A0A2T9YNG7_9FUNG|nr:hypothetical protein BB561_002955 [Smittium simulii]